MSAEYVPSPADLTNLTPAGNLSLALHPVTGLGPRFVIVSVYVTSTPGSKPPSGSVAGLVIAFSTDVFAGPVNAKSCDPTDMRPGTRLTFAVRDSCCPTEATMSPEGACV